MTEETQAQWWSTGYAEMETLPEGDAGDRHYMKTNEERILLFLDGNENDRELFGRPYGAPFCIWEYQIPTKSEEGGVNWRNWATSVRGRKDADGQPMRDFVKENAPDLRPYYVGFHTVVDISEVDIAKLVESGKPLPDSCFKKLLGGKKKLLGILKRHASKKGGLRGGVYTVFRSDGKAPNTGDDWQYEMKLSDDELKILLPEGKDVPFEYAKILVPLPEGEVKGLLAIRTKVTKFGESDKGSGSSSGRQRGERQGSRRQVDSEEVPF